MPRPAQRLQLTLSIDKVVHTDCVCSGVPLAGSDRHAGWQCLRHKFIGAMPSGLSLRGPNGAMAISGRHFQFVQAAVKMEKAEIWGVAALSERLVQGN